MRAAAATRVMPLSLRDHHNRIAPPHYHRAGRAAQRPNRKTTALPADPPPPIVFNATKEPPP